MSPQQIQAAFAEIYKRIETMEAKLLTSLDSKPSREELEDVRKLVSDTQAAAINASFH